LKFRKVIENMIKVKEFSEVSNVLVLANV